MCSTLYTQTIPMQPNASNNSALPSEKLCTQSKCKAVLPNDYQYKTCDRCRNISKLSMQKKRKREKADEGPHCSPATAPGASKEEGPVDSGSETELTQDEDRVSKIILVF